MVCGVGGRTLSVGFHSFRFGWMNLRSWRDAPRWGASSLACDSCQVKPCEWVCGECLCEVKIACFCNKSWVLLPLLYTLGFSHDGVRDNLTHYMHLKRELELLQGFESLLSLWRCIVYVCFCHVLVVFVNGGWYSSCRGHSRLGYYFGDKGIKDYVALDLNVYYDLLLFDQYI